MALLDFLGIGSKIIDRVLPDKEAANAAKLKLLELEQNGQLEADKVQLSAIIAEANSADPWTSRARPSFLYMCYALILSAIPMGLVSAASPELAASIVGGFKGWLEAIPEPIINLMGVGYLGYTGARSFDKRTTLKSDK